MTPTKPIVLANAEAALRHAAGSEFSARVTPAQSQALLEELDRLRGCREALTKIASAGVAFDAKGTHSKRLNDIAREALGR